MYCLIMWVVSPLGSVKILKHSARLSLQVIDGLKIISPLSRLALSFLSFCVLVRDIPSSGSCLVGLCFGGMRFSLTRASAAHLCGFSHPVDLSFLHSWHVQFLSQTTSFLSNPFFPLSYLTPNCPSPAYLSYLWTVLVFSRDFHMIPLTSISFHDLPLSSTTFQ